MPEPRQSRPVPSGRHRGLWCLTQEIARSVETILRSVHGLPVEMRQATLRVARDLLVAQSSVVDRLFHLPEIAPSVDGGPKASSEAISQALARPTTEAHQPMAALNLHASDRTAGMADKGSGRPLETIDSQRPMEAFRSCEGHDVPDMTSPVTESKITSPRTAKSKTGLNNLSGRVIVGLVMVSTSLVFWLSAPSAQRGGRSAHTQETRSAPVVAAAPIAKVDIASNGASTSTPTDELQQAAANRRSEIGPSPLSPLVAGPGGPLTAADPLTPTEPPVSASDNPLAAPPTSTPVDVPPRNVQSTLTSTDLATPAISQVQSGLRPSHAQIFPPEPTLQKGSTRHINQPAAPQQWRVAVRPQGPLTSASAPATAGRFAPVLLTLRDGPAALQIFEGLQKRHPDALANKKAEMRNFVGPDGQEWYRLLAVPAVTQAEATEVCHLLGSEGEALGCTVAAY